MRRWRAGAWLALTAAIAGFPLSVLLMLGLTGWAALLMLDAQPYGTAAGNLALTGLGLVILVGYATTVAVRRSSERPAGIDATAAPELRDLIGELATLAGTPPPQHVLLVDGVNASVREGARGRELFIGVQLLAGLTVDELAAVLAHELGHYSRRDTRVAAVAHRGALWISTAAQAARGTPWQLPLRAYANAYLLVTLAIRRRQEYVADQVAIEATSPAAAAAALLAVSRLEVSWQRFEARYLALGRGQREPACGILAAFESFARVAADGAAPPPRAVSRWATHPPLRERLRALRAHPAQPGPSRPPDRRPARVLVPGDLLGVPADDLLAPRPGVERQEITAIAVRRHLAGRSALAAPLSEAVRALTGRSRPRLTDLTELLEGPGRARLAERTRQSVLLPDGAAAALGALAPLSTRLDAVAELAIDAAGRGRWHHDWAGGVRLDPADDRQLRERLIAAGVDLDDPLPGLGAAPGPALERSGAMVVRWNGAYYDLILHGEALHLWPVVLGEAPSRNPTDRLTRRLAAVVAGTVTDPVVTVAVAQIAAVRQRRTDRFDLELTLGGGHVVTLEESTWGLPTMRVAAPRDSGWVEEQRATVQAALHRLAATGGAGLQARPFPLANLVFVELQRRARNRIGAATMVALGGLPFLILAGSQARYGFGPTVVVPLVATALFLAVAAVVFVAGVAQARRAADRARTAAAPPRYVGGRPAVHALVMIALGLGCPGVPLAALPVSIRRVRGSGRSPLPVVIAAILPQLAWLALCAFLIRAG